MFRFLAFLLVVFCSLPVHAREIRALLGTSDGQGRIILDSPGLNGRPARVVLVTPVVPAGTDPATDYGVFYDAGRERWLVATVDGTAIDPATRFHVAALDPGEAVRHVVEPENLVDGSGTYLPFTNQYDVLLVTADLQGSRNSSPLALRWNGGQGRWTVVNRDGSPMPVGLRLNVWRVDGQIVASTETIQSDSGYLPFVTARHAPGYLVGQAGLRGRSVHERSRYTIATRAGQPATAGEFYNVAILQQQTENPPVAPAAGGKTTAKTPPRAPDAPSGRLVRVLAQDGQPALRAEVWLNDARVGLTNNLGELRLPASAGPNDILFARKVSRNVPSYRHRGHAFQAYKTSWDGAHGQRGSTANVRVGTDTVRVLRLNRAMIGVTLHVSIEWDCTVNYLNWVQTEWLQANDYLYDATDGQFFLEQVTLFDNGAQWDNCDYRHWANADGRASCLPRVWGLVNPHPWSYVNVPRFPEPSTWMHEFGHYGLCLLDEYHEVVGHPPGCTFIGHTDGPSAFHKKKPKAACIMCHHRDTHKICSGFRDNPHHLGTRQGINCWTQIRDCYPDGLVGPAERGFVPGRCEPHAAFKPAFEVHNRDRGTPVDTIDRFLGPAENRWVGEPIWLETGGRSIFQGFTERAGEHTVPGRYTLDGAHVGDRVIHGNFGASFRLTAADLGLKPAHLLAATQWDGLAQRPPVTEDARPRGPRPVRTWVRADGGVQVEGAPQSAAQVIAVSDEKTQPATAGVPINRPCVLRVEQGEKIFLEQAAVFDVVAAPTVEGQAASNDGRLMLEFPETWTGRVAVSSGGEAPEVPAGLLAGPYQVDWSGGKGVEPKLKFRLGDVENAPDATIYRYDGGSGRWLEVGGQFVKFIGYMQSPVDRPGCYALAAPGVAPAQPANARSEARIVHADGSQVRGSAVGSKGDIVLLEVSHPGGEKVYEGVSYSLDAGTNEFAWSLPPLAGGSYVARLRLVDAAGNAVFSNPAAFEVVAKVVAPPPAAPAGETPPAEHLTLTAAEPHGQGQMLLRAGFSLGRHVGVVFTVRDLQGNVLRTSPAYPCGPGEATVQWVVEDLQPNTQHVVTAATADGQVVSAPFSFVTPGYK